MAKPDHVFNALADPTRRTILEALRQGGQTAGSIAARFDVSWPAISRQLRILKAAGLIWETRDGRTRYYELNSAAFHPVLSWLVQFRAEPGRETGTSPGVASAGREFMS